MNMHSPVDVEQHFREVAPTTSFWTRYRKARSEAMLMWALRMVGRLPGLGGIKTYADAMRLQTIDSGAAKLGNFFEAPFGTPDKPASLNEIPWHYVEEHQEEIPFFGLRDYWYPALLSEELRNNEPSAVRLLGDNLVLFRGADGTPQALENRCPHRGALLSLGQVNIWQPGTITCRYHGMTFDGKGECIAFLADGPKSPTCGGAIKAKAYPAIEKVGIIFVWMGAGQPEPIETNLPNGDKVLSNGTPLRVRVHAPYSYLNQLDNTTDMLHVGCLHRSCLLFGDQKMGGGVDATIIDDGKGVHAFLREQGGHGGGGALDEIRWYLPNLVYHGEEFLNGMVSGMWFWFVPDDIGSFTAWNIATMADDKIGKLKARAFVTAMKTAFTTTAKFPSSACFNAGDAPIQLSQGRVVRWDQEMLTRIDKGTHYVRKVMKEKHKAEQEARKALGLDPLVHRVSATKYVVGDK